MSDYDLLRAWDNECAQITDETFQGFFEDWLQRVENCVMCGRNYFKEL